MVSSYTSLPAGSTMVSLRVKGCFDALEKHYVSDRVCQLTVMVCVVTEYSPGYIQGHM